jgi:hypothetical protein
LRGATSEDALLKKLVIAAEVRNSRLGPSSELSHPASDGIDTRPFEHSE